MKGLSIITNFENSTPMFGFSNSNVASIKSDIDFDYIEFLLMKYKFSKLSVSGGTDPLSNLNKKMNIEILRKLAFDNKIRFFIYTKDKLLDKLLFIKYICPSKIVFYNHLMADRNLDEVIAVSNLCPIRLYIDYNNQHPAYINLWCKYFNKSKKIQFCIKQNKKNISSKEMGMLNKNIYVIAPGDYNFYLMPNNLMYENYDSKLFFTTGYTRGKISK